MHPKETKTGLVLPGGGARGAFQVGVLKAIAEMLPPGSVNPFPVISGTSAGAINSVVLASKARRFRVAVAELERVWGHFHSGQVFRTDSMTMFKSSMHWLASIVLGGFIVGMPRSLLDNAPLRSLLSRNVRFPRSRYRLTLVICTRSPLPRQGTALPARRLFSRPSAVAGPGHALDDWASESRSTLTI